LSCASLIPAVALLLLSLAALAVSGCVSWVGKSRQLPDWPGVWALTDQSFWRANVDAYASNISLTPAYQALRAQARAERRQANMTTCLPAGATAVLQHGMLFEILFTPGRVTMLFEDGETRRIYTDGRAHRDLAELHNGYMGDSVGRWEGKTLVVDTIGFPKGELWQNYGVRATLNTHLVERFFLNAKGELQIDSVMTDPAIFSQPYAYTRLNVRQTLPLIESACIQNNRDIGGTVDLTPPEE
jgi:hypothetical protein